MAGGTPCGVIGTSVTPTGGSVVGVPGKVLVSGIPIAKGPGTITPHPPAPYDATHALGLTLPKRKILCEGLPVVAVGDKCTCKCCIVVGIPTVLVGT